MNKDYSFDGQKIIPVEIQREMKKSYIDYAMSVIVGRALPDVRDGLKPVHRRILYAMYEAGLFPDRPYRKSATTVGDVLGKYHPHGDAALYDTLVRMAQDFSLRYTLIDGHGNFGSIDGDPPAAYRYTEARMSKISMEMLADIESDTIDFVPNYDNRMKEPVVLPSRFPNLIVNGSVGIAVGMATNIPPHNLGEAIDAVVALIDNPDIDIAGLMRHIKGPDFPTGAIIMGTEGIRQAYNTGRGKIIIRAKTEIEEYGSGRFRIIVTEIPYQVNKSNLIKEIAEFVRDKRIDGISDLRDESGRNGMRIVIDIKRDANAQVVLNQLFKNSQLQQAFSINMLALVDNQPKTLNLKQMLQEYVDFQKQVIIRRTRFELAKAEKRAHILEGLRVAIENIDEVVAIIKASPSIPEAKEKLMQRFGLTDVQAQAIVEMTLGKLTGLETEKILEELEALYAKIADLKDILASEQRIKDIIKTEILDIKSRFSDSRRTSIQPHADELDDEALVANENCVITLTHFGYIKRLPSNAYRAQHRGGRGVTAMTTREDDYVEELFVANTHDNVLFFTSKGRFFRKKCYEIPESGRASKGVNLVNLLQLDADEKTTAMIRVPEFGDGYLCMFTKRGLVKRTALSEYNTRLTGGVKGILLSDGDELVGVRLTDGNQSLLVATHEGMAIRFSESHVRPTGRASYGVKAITLDDEDYVIGAAIARAEGRLLTVTENGFGKRTEIEEYRLQNRGGKGLIGHNITLKTGNLAAIKVVDDDDDILVISSDGVIIRVPASEVPVYSRHSQGVCIMKLSEGVVVVNIARTSSEAESGDEDGENGEVESGGNESGDDGE